MYRTFVTCTLAYVAASVSLWGRRESWDESKREEWGRRGRRERKGFLFSSLPPPSHVFLLPLQLPRNNSIENAGYVHQHKSPVAQWGRVWSSNHNSGGSREGAWGARPSPYFHTKLRPEGSKRKNFKSGPPISQGLDDRVPPPPPPPYRKVWVRHCRRSWVRFLLKVTYFSET